MNSNRSNVPNRPVNPPSFIEYKNLRFIIFDAPSDANIDFYIKQLLNHNVSQVVRVCEPTYDKSRLEEIGITVHDWPFTDGEAPSAKIVSDWLSLIDKIFHTHKKPTQSSESSTIGVHCVAGLGRAPVLVAMALIEGGMAPLDSVIYIRERRRGAINARQLKYLEAYKKRRADKNCIIS